MTRLHIPKGLVLLSLIGCGQTSIHLDDVPATAGAGGESPAPSDGRPSPLSDAPPGEPTEPSTDSNPYLSDQPQVSALAVDDTRLYWITAAPARDTFRVESVRGCLKDACAETAFEYVRDTGDYTTIVDAAIDRSSIYWALLDEAGSPGYSTIFRCPLHGCDREPHTVVVVPGIVTSIASDGDHVYWTQSWHATVSRCPVTGCVEATPLAFDGYGRSIAVGPELVYWIRERSSALPAILAVPKDGGPVLELTPPLNAPGSLALGPGHVFFTQRYSFGEVGYCPLHGCDGEIGVLVSSQRFPFSIATDGQHVYWRNAEPLASSRVPAIMKARFAPGSSEARALAVQRPSDHPFERTIAVDDAFVYWTDPGPADSGSSIDASIRRTPKDLP